MSKPTSHSDIIGRFKDRPLLAAALEVAVSTLGSFRHRDSIPSEYWNRLVAHGREVGVPVDLQELADAAEARTARAA